METTDRTFDALARYLARTRWEQPIPVILGAHINGLGLVRSFGEAGVPSIVLESCPNLAFYSRYTKGAVCPDPLTAEAAFLDFLERLGTMLPHGGVLYTTNDVWMFPVCRERARLEPYYRYPMSPWPTIELCLDKARVYDIAEEQGIPYPRSLTTTDIASVGAGDLPCPFPVIFKPTVTVGFMERLEVKRRTLVAQDAAEFTAIAARIREKGMGDVPLVIQEYIPGGAETLYTITAYSNPEAEIIAYSTGHKIRQMPPDCGTIISGRVREVPELLTLGQALMSAVRFHGISNTEFKYDARDGRYKLMEINPRPGMWNYSVQAAGLNLPYLSYREVLGERLPVQGGTAKELVWVQTYNDWRAATRQFRRMGFREYALTPREWWQSLDGHKVDPIFSRTDPYPGLRFVLDRLGLRRLRHYTP